MFFRLKLNFRPCQKAVNVAFDVGTSMVTMLLDRHAIDFPNEEALIDDETFEIEIRDEWLDRPLFGKGLPGGGGVTFDRPMSAASISAFMSRVCKQLGFGKSSSESRSLLDDWRRVRVSVHVST